MTLGVGVLLVAIVGMLFPETSLLVLARAGGLNIRGPDEFRSDAASDC